MANQLSFLLLFVILSSFAFSSSSALDTLKASESLNFTQTLISSGNKFEAGFFIPPGAEPENIYLGIWYYNLTNVKTFVWVSNRDNPARNSSVVLRFESGQAVVTENDVVLWGSNKSSSTNVVSPLLQLLDTGNLVVREDDDQVEDYIWQSFDYPTDTLLPEQKIGWTKNTGLDRRLISWKSESDPGTGNYSFTLTRTGDPEMFVRSGSETIYRTGPFVGQALSGVPSMKSRNGINYTLPDTPDEIYYMFALTDPTIRSRVKMDSQGTLYRYAWVPGSEQWNTYWYFPQDPCDKYMACGTYGVCEDSNLFDCRCPHGFVARDTLAVNLRDGSHGCARRTSLECGTDGFRVLRNMKLPESGGAVVDRDMKLEDCKVACKRDCNCTAYSNLEVIDGVGSGCVMWKGDLLDMSSFTDGGQDLYFCLAAADLGTNKSKEVKIGIGVSVVVVTFIVAITAAYFAWKAKHKPGATTNQNLFLHNNDEDDWELPFYSFDAIVAITNNFSDENKLGYGGFGSVFKGVLNGVQEVAIKRLSKESVQGLEEFKNEVNLIAKLQHRNLVRLLGYCVDKDEKMLIYEYLRNRSLDYILFSRSSTNIKRGVRHSIGQGGSTSFVGVARGLVYLHHDSRLRIIHRDLKASNVLLDDNMNPKISDFGMARIFRGDETESNNTRRVVGTYGYMSPEYAMNGVFSIKSDVFSFGVLVLEIVTGTQNRAFRYSDQLNLLGYSWKMWEEGKGEEVVDPSLRDSYVLHEVLKCVQIGLLCVQAKPTERPTMSSVFLMLSSEISTLPQAKLPGFYMGWGEGEADFYSSQDKSMSINQVTVTMVDGR